MGRHSLPYSSLTIDTNLSHILTAITHCLSCTEKDVAENEEKLRQIWTTPANGNPVLPCLSVRSGWNLFLQAQAYPEGSEVIMSAVNIEDMARIVRYHKLTVVPVDIDIDTLEPKSNLLEKLITARTVAIVIAHIYGSRMDMKPFISIAKKYNLHVIEDCAESFSGYRYIGHPESDISLFSFGAIKYLTSFGGGIAKVKDVEVLSKMQEIHSQYPRQSNNTYLLKVLKYGIMYSILHVKPFPQIIERLRRAGYDFKELFIVYLRGFPSALMSTIRHKPSSALLAVMALRHSGFDKADFGMQQIKGEYFLNGLPEEMWPVGMGSKNNTFWLFPVVVENPDEVIKSLTSMGVDAYRGTTQLNKIEPDNADSAIGPSLLTGKMVSPKERYPNEAKYLIDHVIYMPINKHVPFWALDKMMKICSVSMLSSSGDGSPLLTSKEGFTSRMSRVKSNL